LGCCTLTRELSESTESGNPTDASYRINIGFVPQSLALYDNLTAEENLLFFGRLYNLRGRRLHEEVSRCLVLAGLEDRKNHRVDTYSAA